MKLLVVSSWFPSPPTNGSKIRAWHLLRELATRHEVSLLTFAEDGEGSAAAVEALRGFCRDVRIVAGNPHKPSGPIPWRRYFGRMPRSYAHTFSTAMAAAVSAEARADVIVGLQIGAALYLPGRPMATVYEEAEGSTIRDRARAAGSRLHRWRHGMAWKKYARFNRHLVAQTSRTTVVSDAERECLAEVGCDVSRIAVLPNGVADAYLDRDAPRRTGTLIYSGAVSYGPNLDAVELFTEQILPRVQAGRRDVSFAVTGAHAGVAVDHLTRAGATFTGFVPDVADVVASSEVCVVPLRQGGGTRLKILEAMALGTPVVSTRKGAEGLEVIDGEHLLLADTPEAFAAAVLSLLNDRARARALAANARRLIADRYTWTRIGQAFEHVLAAAVETHRRTQTSGDHR